MAIHCSNCGRQYDDRLFQFGRTIDCHCGARVGLATRVDLTRAGELRFFADVNVGRLARWLRALSLDTAWEDAIEDGALVRRALEENRYILTLDKRLPEEWRVANVLLLTSEKPLAQLREVVARFQIEFPKRLFKRCLKCNADLRPASEAEIAAQASPAVREQYKTFQYCPHCRRVFWHGSHAARMRAALEDVFKN